MAMPKATVYKNYLTAAWKSQIRRAGKVFTVKTESVTVAMKKTTHDKLWFGVL